MPVWSVGPTTTHACRCFQKYTRQDVHARMSRWIHSTAPVSTLYLVLRISLEDAAWKNTATFSCSCHIREPPGLRHVSLFFAKSRLRHGFQNLGNTQNLVGGDFSFYSTWRGVRATYPVFFYLSRTLILYVREILYSFRTCTYRYPATFHTICVMASDDLFTSLITAPLIDRFKSSNEIFNDI